MKFTIVLGLQLAAQCSHRSHKLNDSMRSKNPPGDLQALFCTRTIAKQDHFKGSKASPISGAASRASY